MQSDVILLRLLSNLRGSHELDIETKMAKTPVEIRSLARSYTKVAIETLVGIATSRSAPAAARVAASIALLDRGWGRPEQTTYADVVHRYVARVPAKSASSEAWSAEFGGTVDETPKPH